MFDKDVKIADRIGRKETKPEIAKPAHNPFTGKVVVLVYSEAMKALGLDPVAEFKPPAESRHGTENASFPLEFLARKADNFLNSTFSNVPSVQNMEEASLLQIHSSDAEARGIANGETVRVYNRRGEIRLKARVDGAVQPGVVAATLNWAKLDPSGTSMC